MGHFQVQPGLGILRLLRTKTLILLGVSIHAGQETVRHCLAVDLLSEITHISTSHESATRSLSDHVPPLLHVSIWTRRLRSVLIPLGRFRHISLFCLALTIIVRILT